MGGSTSLYYISLYLGWDDQHRNTNMNDKDHLVGQLTSAEENSWLKRLKRVEKYRKGRKVQTNITILKKV